MSNLQKALCDVQEATGFDVPTIAKKARVSRDDVERALSGDGSLDDDPAIRLAVFCSQVLTKPMAVVLTMLRQASGRTQAEVAEAIDVPRLSVSRWERGSRVPQTHNVLELWKFYDLELGGGLPLIEFAAGSIGNVRDFLESR